MNSQINTTGHFNWMNSSLLPAQSLYPLMINQTMLMNQMIQRQQQQQQQNLLFQLSKALDAQAYVRDLSALQYRSNPFQSYPTFSSPESTSDQCSVSVSTQENDSKEEKVSPSPSNSSLPDLLNAPVAKKQIDVEKKQKVKIQQDKKDSGKKQKKNFWLDSEDALLLNLLEVYGEKWTKIASFLKERTGKQVRDRYLNYLRPSIKQSEWTPEEDNLLKQLYGKLGNRWKTIATYLNGRSENQVKNRFYAMIRRAKKVGSNELNKTESEAGDLTRIDGDLDKSITFNLKSEASFCSDNKNEDLQLIKCEEFGSWDPVLAPKDNHCDIFASCISTSTSENSPDSLRDVESDGSQTKKKGKRKPNEPYKKVKVQNDTDLSLEVKKEAF